MPKPSPTTGENIMSSTAQRLNAAYDNITAILQDHGNLTLMDRIAPHMRKLEKLVNDVNAGEPLATINDMNKEAINQYRKP